MGIAREVNNKTMQPREAKSTSVWLSHLNPAVSPYTITPLEKEVIDLIRLHGDLTKADFVTFTNYSRTKVSTCVDTLLSRKILITHDTGSFTGGRRSRVYSLNANMGLIAGVDIGATSIDVVLADFQKNVLARFGESANVREGPIVILEQVAVIISAQLAKIQKRPEELVGIGIGVPGPVDYAKGTLLSPPIMPGWDDYPIISKMQEFFPNASVVVDNDVNVMALGEITHGAAIGVDNLIFVKIGTGIGSGIICDGKIYRGTNGSAGDIGHICADKHGPICHCGNVGCLEAVAAGPAIAQGGLRAVLDGKSQILKKYYDRNGGFIRSEDVGNAAREGDQSSLEIIRESGKLIGDVLAGLVNFYNPSMLIIGGGVSNIGNLLLSAIKQGVLNRSLPLATRDLSVIFSEMGADAGVIGAVNLAIDNLFQIVTINNGY